MPVRIPTKLANARVSEQVVPERVGLRAWRSGRLEDVIDQLCQHELVATEFNAPERCFASR